MTKRLAMIASKGTLDWSYPPFVIGSAAIAMGWEVVIFFTFYGLQLLLKDLDPKLSPLGNPAMPMKMPFGPEGFQSINWPVPNLMMVLPGFDQAATSMMKKTFQKKGVASLQELRDVCIEGGATLIACQMTMDLFGYQKEDFIPSCSLGGAASFLEIAADADVQLFI